MTMLSFENDLNSIQILTLPNFLTKEECEIIIDYANKQKKVIAKVGLNTLDKETRSNNIGWLSVSRDKSLGWLFNKIASVIYKSNKDVYNFHIIGLTEDIQFTEYCEIDDHYKWHTDCGGSNVRKISASIQLSDPKDYEGCELEFAHYPHIDETKKETDISKLQKEQSNIAKQQGSIIIFPSYLTHRVTQLKSGKRYSLVVWVGGNKFI